MMKKVRGHKIDTIFVLLIFCVFAVSVLMVLMLGANTYKNMTEISRDGQDERTVLSYIWSKVKNGDEDGGVTIDYFHGLPALFIDDEIDATVFRTTIYLYDGWVYELFSEAGLDFFPEDGVKIIRAEQLKFESADYGMIRVSSGDYSLLISPMGGYTAPLPSTDSSGEGGASFE